MAGACSANAPTSGTPHTPDLNSKLIHSEKNKLTVKLMNIFKQEGGADCALFAMAVITSLALGNDLLQEVYLAQYLGT